MNPDSASDMEVDPCTTASERWLMNVPDSNSEICYGCWGVIAGESFRAPCVLDHKYCMSCIRKLYEVAITDPNCWPVSCCGVPFITTATSMSKFLTPYESNVYCEKSMERATSLANRVYCSRSGCGMYLGSREGKRNAAKCQCGATTCWTCKHPASEADTATQQSVVLTPPEEQLLAVEAGWQRCRDCGTIVERNGGCRHMVCGFEKSYCYYSGKIEWTFDLGGCRCRRSDGRLHCAAAAIPASVLSWPDPVLTLSSQPSPHLGPPPSPESPVPGMAPAIVPAGTTSAQANSPIVPRIEGFFHRPYPFQLPNIIAEGPPSDDAISRERDRWEVVPEEISEIGGEGASCLRMTSSPTPSESVSIPPSESLLISPLESVATTPSQEREFNTGAFHFVQEARSLSVQAMALGRGPLSPLDTGLEYVEDSIWVENSRWLHVTAENSPQQPIVRVPGVGDDSWEFADAECNSWWIAPRADEAPPQPTTLPLQVNDEVMEWREEQRGRDQQFRLEFPPGEVARRRNSDPHSI